MTGRDRIFVLGTVGATAILTPLLVAAQPFGEARATLGVLAGWGLALLVVVPSYVLLLKALRATETRKFYSAFLGGTMGRFVISIAAIAMFALLVPEAPIKSFMTSFFVGYMLLTGLELGMALSSAGNSAQPGGHS